MVKKKALHNTAGQTTLESSNFHCFLKETSLYWDVKLHFPLFLILWTGSLTGFQTFAPLRSQTVQGNKEP